MIAVRLPGQDAPRLVEALLIAAGVAPRPTDPAARRAYLALANDLGEGLDTLPAPTTAAKDTATTADRHDGGNVAAAATAGDTTNRPAQTGTGTGEADGADQNGASR